MIISVGKFILCPQNYKNTLNILGNHCNHLSYELNDDFVTAWSYQFVFVNQYSHASLNLGSLWGMSNLAFHNDYHVPRKDDLYIM